MADEERYEALLSAEGSLREALCLTVVEGCDAKQALSRMGADPATLGRRTVAESASLGWPALAAPVTGGAVVLEPNGFQATRPEVIRALTAGGGRSTTVYWNVNTHHEALRAENGRTRWRFRPPPDEPDGPIDEVHRAIEDLPFDDEWSDSSALLLILLERETGFALGAEWLATAHLSASLIELPEDIVSPENADHPALAEPEIAAIIADPSSVDRRRIDVITAERAVRMTGVTDPAVIETLRLLRANETVPAELVDRLKRLSADLWAASSAARQELGPDEAIWSSRAGELSRQAETVRAVLCAAGLFPPFDACYTAGQAVIAVERSFPDDALVIAVMKKLRHHARNAGMT